MDFSNIQVNELIRSRRSVRLMTGERVSDQDLMSLFEAARWAPSSYNEQPWRILYVQRDTECWDRLFSCLEETNKPWVKKASVLLVILAKRFSDYKKKPIHTYLFDVGAACQNLALQAWDMRLAACCLGGFNCEKVRDELSISDNFEIPVMMAIGRPRAGVLEKLKSVRKPLEELVDVGPFPGLWKVSS